MFKTKPQYFYNKNLLSILLLPLSWIYSIFFVIKTYKFFKGKKISNITICVGNIVVGGSGKTPICIEIGKKLKKHNKICFLTKGYNRKDNGRSVIIPERHKELFDIVETGDEAILLSEIADTFIVKKRNERNLTNYDIAITDDGYFDNTIHKDIVIAVFDGNFFIGNGKVLPAGPMRYYLKSLSKADFVIITNATNNDFEMQKIFLQQYIDKNNILLADLSVISKHSKYDMYIAFSGIGENEKFFRTLQKDDMLIIDAIGFEDHCEYNEKHLQKIRDVSQKHNIKRLITTSKDYAKLPKSFCNEFDIEVLEIKYVINGFERIEKKIIEVRNRK